MVDIETTGGNYFQDRIIEIAIIIHDGERVLSEFQSLVNPERPILPFISKLTGISNSMVKKAPTFKEIADQIFDMLNGHIFVAHNVRFDYGFVKAAFKAQNIRYRSAHLCTVELSRAIFPGLPSYSLGKLCKSLEVPVSNRHRAFGDTEATSILFKKIWEKDAQRVLRELKSDEIVIENFPPGFNIDDLESVSETNGVYTFYDQDAQPIYIAKAKNVRNSILSHFKTPFDQQESKLVKAVRSFEVVEMPSDMSAMMLESQKILTHRPPHNKTVKVVKQKLGLFLEEDERGYLDYKIVEVQNRKKAPLIKFNSSGKATKYIQQAYAKLQLNSTHKQILSSEKYNGLIRSSIQYITYPYQNCWIIENKNNQELSAVYIIQDYELKGFSMLEDIKHKDFDEVLSKMYKVNETVELRRSFLQMIRQKKSHLDIIDLGVSED